MRPDAKDVKLKLEPKGKFSFSATAGADNVPYEIDVNLHDKVDVNVREQVERWVEKYCLPYKERRKQMVEQAFEARGKGSGFSAADMDFGDIDFSFYPMDDKDEDINVKTDTRNLARGRMEGFKTTIPSVMLKYPESIHFSTTCMIKDTDLANWDDIWYVSNRIDRHVYYKLDFFYNIKEVFLVKELENQRKLLFTYGIGEVLIEDGGQGCLVPRVHYAPEVTLNILSIDLLEKQGFKVKYDGKRSTLSRMFNNKEIQFFDEDKMRTMQNKYIEDYFESLTKKNKGIKEDLIKIKGNLITTKEGLGGYLSVHFCQEFDTIGEILGLSKRNGEEVKECYLKYLDVFVSYFKTARAPEQGYKNTLVESAWKAEKDIDCLGTHQWDFGENGAPMTRAAILKGKKTLEHFGVKLEDTTDSQERPNLPHSTRSQNLQGIDEDDTDTEEEAKEEEAIGKQEVAPPVSNQVEATT
ncbi:hypothetical protein Tco_0286795 [Tanacetum coccineum]